MEQTTIDLSNLTVHHLDVDPREHVNAIEFQLHATIGGLDETTLATCASKELNFEEIVASFDTDTEHTTEPSDFERTVF